MSALIKVLTNKDMVQDSFPSFLTTLSGEVYSDRALVIGEVVEGSGSLDF